MVSREGDGDFVEARGHFLEVGMVKHPSSSSNVVEPLTVETSLIALRVFNSNGNWVSGQASLTQVWVDGETECHNRVERLRQGDRVLASSNSKV